MAVWLQPCREGPDRCVRYSAKQSRESRGEAGEARLSAPHMSPELPVRAAALPALSLAGGGHPAAPPVSEQYYKINFYLVADRICAQCAKHPTDQL